MKLDGTVQLESLKASHAPRLMEKFVELVTVIVMVTRFWATIEPPLFFIV